MKNLFIILFFCCFFASICPAKSFECLSYSSASSLKYELNSMNRQINNNNYKIRSIKNSRNLSEYEKKRQIRNLENKNRYLQRDINKTKKDYRRAIS